MTTPNHIAGGLFFTGFWCSFWHINIFSEPLFIGATVVGSMLPDVDHTKSPIGLALYPIAKAINYRFGHRTITHSLLFLLLGTLATYGITKMLAHNGELPLTMSLIFFFSVLSHFILDMVTTQGIPLFYPFFKNPCVIPGNPDYRFNSGSLRPEITAFILFIGMNFLCSDLYANGFWTQFNRTLGQIPSLSNEFKNTPNYLLVDYDFTQDGKRHIGKGTVLYASFKEIALLTKHGVYNLKEDIPNQDINYLKPSRTNIPFKINQINLLSVPLDSLKSKISNLYLTGTIQSDLPFYIDESGIVNRKTEFQLKDKLNPMLYTIPDTSKLSELKTQLRAKQYALAKKQVQKVDNKYYQMQSEISNLKNQLANTNDIADKVVIENKLIRLNNSFASMTPPIPTAVDNSLINAEIAELQMKIQQYQNHKQSFNTSLSYPVLPIELTRQLTEK